MQTLKCFFFSHHKNLTVFQTADWWYSSCLTPVPIVFWKFGLMVSNILEDKCTLQEQSYISVWMSIFVICKKIQYLIWLFAWRKKISVQCSYCASGAQNCLHKVANKVAHTPMQWWSRGLLRSHPMPKFQILHKTKVGKKS